MKYQYKLIVNNRNFYKEFEITENIESVKIGTDISCEFRLNSDYFFEEIELNLEKKDNWHLSCRDNLYISKGDIRKLFFTELKHGDVFKVCYADSGEDVCEIRFLIDFEATVPDYNWKIDLAKAKEITISDKKGSDIVLNSTFGKNTEVHIKETIHGVELSEQKSLYGIYVNGKNINRKIILEDCDFVSVADFSFYYYDGKLFFDIKNITINCEYVVNSDYRAGTSYPMFVRNTRIKSQIDEEKIKILDPQSIPTKPELNIVTSLMPTIVMFVLVVVLRGIMSTTGGTYILFSICSMGMGVVTSVFSIYNNQKKYKRECEKRKDTYLNYIENKEKEIIAARQLELACLRDTYYSTKQDLEHIKTFDTCLFDRKPEDEDFLEVYLGTGVRVAKKKIDYKLQEKLESGDELSQLPTQVSDKYRCIDNAPIVVELKNANAVGVIGNKEQLYQMLKCFMIDLITRQYYGDLSVYALLGEDIKKYDWMRHIPHMQKNKPHRNIVCDNESKNNIFEYLYKELSARDSAKGIQGWNVVLVMEENGIKSHPISEYIEKASELNTVFVFFEEKEELLPLHCSKVIKIEDGKSGILFESKNRADIQKFNYVDINDSDMAEATKILAPIYCEEISLESSLRKSISLFELLGIYSVKDIDLGKRWSNSHIYDSIAVPLGVNVKDDIVYLDLHEKYHGPHGLVAGTTGSGKSEILQTYILSASTLFHPYEIGFVIIDFKGGGMVNQFKDLPHLIGAITNIDGKAIERSLKSIRAELLKRQALFAEAGVNHIDRYIKKYKNGEVEIALPHLVIIVDEFAELKAEQPEFMKELISAARIGRSLGVHLILATQKPAGQVNEQIWSNSKFKLCLKVQTKEDSNEVLKSPLASEIREPGRAYLQVGNNEVFELLQSGFSGSPEKIDDSKMKSIKVDSLNFKGTHTTIFEQKPKRDESTRTQLEAIVDYVNKYCKDKKIVKLQEICLPELPQIISQDKSLNVETTGKDIQCSIGIYDDPDNQYQGIASLSISSQNTIIIGSSQYGKTNLLETIIRNVTESYSPDEVNMYIIDFGSMVLKNFEKLAHVGGVVCPSDDEKIKNLFKYLNDQVTYRREKLVSVGVSSFSAYKEAGYEDLPQIIVFIDNLTALRELYLQDNDYLLKLCREGVSVGISFVVANAQTTGLGYKYLANFSSRIALFCTETSEYSSLFGMCRMRPDEIPGRGLIEIDKSVYECQMFLAFEGDKEIERVQNMHNFIQEIHEKYNRMRAVPIPEIPDILSETYIFDNYSDADAENRQVLGLNYETVHPVSTDIMKVNMMALSGAEDTGKSNFINYFVHALLHKGCKIELFVFDDYRKKLSALTECCEKVVYEITTEHYKDTLMNLELYLENRYQELISGNDLSNEWKILIINNEDVVSAISNDKIAMSTLKNIVGKYKMLNVYVIFGCVPNASIAYGAPEAYKLVKDIRNILFFGNIDSCKLVDIPLTVVRNYKKKISIGDAYYIYGTDCYKIKTPLALLSNGTKEE